MFKRLNLLSYLKYSLIAAIVYCIPVAIFVKNGTYTDAWLLYLGNGLFLCPIAIFLLSFNRKRKENASSISMLFAGHATAVMGILVACLISFIILIIFIPGIFHSGTAGKVLTEAPVTTVRDKTNGLIFMVFTNAIVGNISTGSFASIIFAFSIKRDQTKESAASNGGDL